MKQLAERKKQFELAQQLQPGTPPRIDRGSEARKPLQAERSSPTDLGWDRWLPINYRLG